MPPEALRGALDVGSGDFDALSYRQSGVADEYRRVVVVGSLGADAGNFVLRRAAAERHLGIVDCVACRGRLLGKSG